MSIIPVFCILFSLCGHFDGIAADQFPTTLKDFGYGFNSKLYIKK